MNNVTLIGRLARDPEVRYTNQQMAIARFSLAVDRAKKDAGADFISCVAFGKTAEIVEKYTGKGRQLALNGHIQTGSYEKEGQKVYTTEVVADRVFLIGSKQADNATPDAPQAEVPDGFALIDDDIPF